jgi:hypothetical protein
VSGFRLGGIAETGHSRDANIVIPAQAGIQTWRPLRPSLLDSRFRGNDASKRVIGAVSRRQTLGRCSGGPPARQDAPPAASVDALAERVRRVSALIGLRSQRRQRRCGARPQCGRRPALRKLDRAPSTWWKPLLAKVLPPPRPRTTRRLLSRRSPQSAICAPTNARRSPSLSAIPRDGRLGAIDSREAEEEAI